MDVNIISIEKVGSYQVRPHRRVVNKYRITTNRGSFLLTDLRNEFTHEWVMEWAKKLYKDCS